MQTRHSRQAVMLVIGLVAVPRIALAQPTASVAVQLINQAEVPADVMAAAQAETSRIYATLGVELVWRGRDQDIPETTAQLTIVVIPNAFAASTRGALGTALATSSIE